MSFGFGVGDFLAVGKLVWGVYSAYADAPEQFRNFSQEILAVHVVVRKVEDQLGISGFDGTASRGRASSGASGSGSQLPVVATLSMKDRDDLKILYDGLEAIMKELDDLLRKYKSLESTRNPIDRFKWGQEDLVGLRDKIRSNITSLTAFNSTLANCQLAHQRSQLGQQNVQLVQQNAQLIDIQQQLGQLLVAGGLRRRGSVASLNSIASFALSIGQKTAWKELCRDLHQNGVTADMIKARRDEVLKVFQTAGFSASGNSRSHDENAVQSSRLETISTHEEGNQDGKSNRALFDGIVDALSLQAMRAKHLVADLGVKRLFGKSIDTRNTDVHSETALIDTRDANGETALHRAAANGLIDLVKVLLDQDANIEARITYSYSARIYTALHCAASGGHIEVVNLLLDRGATMNSTIGDKWTALHSAADRGHVDVVKVLLDRGATIDATNNEGRAALHQAAQKGHIEVVELLFDRGAHIGCMNWDNSTALYDAARGGHTEVVKLLLDRGARIDATSFGIHGQTALHGAAVGGHVEAVKVLLDRGASIGVTSSSGFTALHCAAHENHIEVVKLLLGRGATMDAIIDGGETALHIAASMGHAETVKELVDRGANIDATDDEGRTALHVACAAEVWGNGNVMAAMALLERCSNIHVTDKDGYTALHYAARNHACRGRLLQMLVEHGANIHRKNAEGETALDIVREWGGKRGVKRLMSMARNAHSSALAQ